MEQSELTASLDSKIRKFQMYHPNLRKIGTAAYLSNYTVSTYSYDLYMESLRSAGFQLSKDGYYVYEYNTVLCIIRLLNEIARQNPFYNGCKIITPFKFHTEDEIQFFNFAYMLPMIANASPSDLNSSNMIHGHSLYQDSRDSRYIEAISRVLSVTPGVPFDIVAYRYGEMSNARRPFLPASLLKESNRQFKSNFLQFQHKIIIKQGAVILPTFFNDVESSISIQSQRLSKKLGYYCQY